MEQNLKQYSARIRTVLLKLLKAKKGGHLGGSMSIVEVLSVLYGEQMKYDPRDPDWEERDLLVLSKGHAGPGLYAALCTAGFFPEEELYTLNEGGTRFPSHPDRTKTPGVDATTGSLGQGTSVAAGLGYGLKLKNSTRFVYLITGDGELNEGQCWEAFQFIAHHKLHNVIVLIDDNKRQLDGYTADILNPFSLEDKMKAFGFHTETVDGADERQISDAVRRAKAVEDSAVCIILDTVKGQGSAYFEKMESNHSVKFNEQDCREVDKILDELADTYRLEEQ
ncbi:transketolase [[Clostridium] hylemonae]|uniref:transketolase n=1 Tax=[Clostridium] hylemonae TaxID=89153 RepID=UPI001FCB852E|nr:transketolase [[Clostridium] hylemonae]BDF02977.1 carbohydrate degradation protein [[Clostridium] hylemonae]